MPPRPAAYAQAVTAIFQKVHPNLNAAEFSAKMSALRKQVRVELLTLLERVR